MLFASNKIFLSFLIPRNFLSEPAPDKDYMLKQPASGSGTEQQNKPKALLALSFTPG
jgi:hypothetical protein